MIQLLKEEGVDLPTDASAIATGKPRGSAWCGQSGPGQNASQIWLCGDETSWWQGLPPGQVGPQLSEFELSESDSDSSVASILGVCLDGFKGDAWISDAEGVQDDVQVGEAAGVNDPGDIPWRTTVWSAWGEDVGSVKAAKTVGEGAIQPSSALSGKTVTFHLQETALIDNDGADGEAPRKIEVSEGGAAGGGATLTKKGNKKLRWENKTKQGVTVNKRFPVQKGLTALKKEAIMTRNNLKDILRYSRESESAQL